MKIHKHTWQSNGILCDYPRCYEGKTIFHKNDSWDIRIFLSLILGCVFLGMLGVLYLPLQFLLSPKVALAIGILISVSLILFSRQYGVTKK